MKPEEEFLGKMKNIKSQLNNLKAEKAALPDDLSKAIADGDAVKAATLRRRAPDIETEIGLLEIEGYKLAVEESQRQFNIADEAFNQVTQETTATMQELEKERVAWREREKAISEEQQAAQIRLKKIEVERDAKKRDLGNAVSALGHRQQALSATS